MAKPVEIEILLRDRLSGGLEKNSQGVGRLLGAARRASLEIQGEIEKQRKVISGLNTDLGKMESKLQGMKPGDGQRQLMVEISACKKVLAEESETLTRLEREHEQACQSVSRLEQEYKGIVQSEEQAAAQSKNLTSRIAEQKAIVKQTEADVKALQKTYDDALPGRSKQEALAELNAAKKALDEDKAALAGLTSEQERNKESNRRLSMQLRDMQNALTRMRMEGKQNTEEYRQMSEKAAVLSDTLADVKKQTSILSNDDANLQGLISGVNGLSGAFTTATGVMSLFATQNENLQKVQARLQSVMAITMGLQQMFNALNKDSAFRLVTLTRAKELLTAANSRLAVALGISNTAASVLMGTLTLGLSAAITGLIVLWDKLNSAQEEAGRKSLEMVETEAQGRAEMLKTRFEIDSTRESLRNFTGTKEEEKQKCEELNRKYGEAFGYYDKVSEWYDVLTNKAEQYVQILFLQAKAQALVNKAIEADEKLNKHKATKPGKAETDMGFWSSVGLIGTIGPLDGFEQIQKHNKEAYDKRTRELTTERDNALKEASDFQKQAAAIGKGANIGGHYAPKTKIETKRQSIGKTTTEEQQTSDEIAKLLSDTIKKLQEENMTDSISLIKDEREKAYHEAEKEYNERLSELEALADEWTRLNKKTGAQTDHDGLTYEQRDELNNARLLAKEKRTQKETHADARARAQQQQQKQEENAQKFQALKESIDWETTFSNLDRISTESLNALKDKLHTLLGSGSILPEDAKVLSEKILEIEDKISERGNIWSSLIPALKERERITREVAELEKETAIAVGNVAKARAEQTATTIGVQGTLSNILGRDIQTDDLKGSKEDILKRLGIDKVSPKFSEVSKALDTLTEATQRTTQAEEAAANAKKSEDIKKNILEGFKGKGVTGGLGDIFSNAVSMAGGGALGIGKLIQTNANSMAELTDKIGLGQTEFGEAVHGFADGVNGFMGAVQSLASGDVFGAISGIIDGIGGFGEIFGINWSGGNEAEYAATMAELTQKNEDLIIALDSLREELANSKGALAVDAYNKSKEAQQLINDNALRKVTEQMGYHSAHHSWNYYWGGFSQQQLQSIRSQRSDLAGWAGDIHLLTPEEAKALVSITEVREMIRNTGKGPYGESVLNELDEYAKLAGELKSLQEQLYESLTTTTKEDVFSGFLDSLYDLADGSETVFEDIADNWQQMVNKMAINNLVGAKFQKQLEQWYNSLGMLNEQKSKGMISDYEYRNRLEGLKTEYDNYVKQAQNDIETLKREGIIKSTSDEDSSDSSKSSKTSGSSFSSMSYDQGTKLEGLFTNGLIVWKSIDGKMTDVATQMSAAASTLAKIEENTAATALSLREIKNDIQTIKRDGLTMK